MKSLLPAPTANGFLFQTQVKSAFVFLDGHLPRARRPASFKTMSASKDSLSVVTFYDHYEYDHTILRVGRRDLRNQFTLIVIPPIVVFKSS